MSISAYSSSLHSYIYEYLINDKSKWVTLISTILKSFDSRSTERKQKCMRVIFATIHCLNFVKRNLTDVNDWIQFNCHILQSRMFSFHEVLITSSIKTFYRADKTFEVWIIEERLALFTLFKHFLELIIVQVLYTPYISRV